MTLEKSKRLTKNFPKKDEHVHKKDDNNFFRLRSKATKNEGNPVAQRLVKDARKAMKSKLRNLESKWWEKHNSGVQRS